MKANGKSDPARQPWVMAMLVSIYASNFIDRTIINILQEPIKIELGLEDWQLGMLSGTAFAIFYCGLGIFVARLAEKGDRIRILTICIMLWSMFTILCGLVTNFVQLLLLRIGVAVGEAGATPTGHSLISDYYPPEKRAGAIAVFHLGNTIGAIIGALLGAYVGHAWGWRWAFLVAGAPGMLIALLTYLTVGEPRRAETAVREDIPPTHEVVRTLFGKKTFRHLAAGIGLMLFTSFSLFAFITPHLMRSYELPLHSAGLIGGVGGGLSLGIGTLAGGFTAQHLAIRDRRWMMWILAGSMLLAAPLCATVFLSSQLYVTIACFAGLAFCLGTFQGPLFSTVHSLVLPRMRATASATMLLTITLFGLGLGPLLIGLTSDLLGSEQYGSGDYAACKTLIDNARCQAASAAGLRYALMSCTVILLWSACHFFMAAKSIRSDVLD